MEIKENRIVAYLRGVREELSKVTWPNRKQVLSHTVLVVAVCLIVAFFLGIMDYAFSLGVQKIIG